MGLTVGQIGGNLFEVGELTYEHFNYYGILNDPSINIPNFGQKPFGSFVSKIFTHITEAFVSSTQITGISFTFNQPSNMGQSGLKSAIGGIELSTSYQEDINTEVALSGPDQVDWVSGKMKIFLELFGFQKLQ